MPSCTECMMLVNNECSAYPVLQAMLGRPLPTSPLGGCILPIVRGYLHLIKEGMHVLEIGCGSWDIIKRHCENVGAHYEGIDTQTEYFGKKTVATRMENLAELSFADEHFDLLIGNQSMEHWAENGCTLKWGLYQCFRVCKDGGKVLLNVPIHFHGTRIFMLGNLKQLRKLLSPFSSQISFHKWGHIAKPLQPVFPFPGYWMLRDKPAYILDVSAVKNLLLADRNNNRWATSGRLAQLLTHPFSFNLYRLLCKIGLI